MDINTADIRFTGLQLISTFLNGSDEIISYDEISKLNLYELCNEKQFHMMLSCFVSGCIEGYHNQLRKKLLEFDIDIGEITSKPNYEAIYRRGSN